MGWKDTYLYVPVSTHADLMRRSGYIDTLFFAGEMERNEILLLPLFRYLTYLVFYCSAEYMG